MLLPTILGVLVTLVIVGGIGFGLHAAAEGMAVQPRRGVPSILSRLPRTDCGACGYPTCQAYAEAINAHDIAYDRCLPGGSEVTDALRRVLERRNRVSSPTRVVQVHCRGGGDQTNRVFEHRGMMDCNALYALYQGNLACKEACLGMGSCIRACPHDAVSYDDAGKVWVDARKCTGCGTCVGVCPTGVLRWVPADADVVVACNNHDEAQRVREICSVGCIACRLCERRSPGGGFAVESNLAEIHYEAGGNRLPALRACPTRCIVAMSGRIEELGRETVVQADEEN
jgi:Na+-translocating ferredoxin:NAD+ oxidoreductase RNF subunit RnfB